MGFVGWRELRALLEKEIEQIHDGLHRVSMDGVYHAQAWLTRY
jgi:hypothetical protein